MRLLNFCFKVGPSSSSSFEAKTNCLFLPLVRVGVCGFSSGALLPPLLAGEAGGELVLPREEAEVRELALLPPRPAGNASISMCDAPLVPLPFPLASAGAVLAGGVACVHRFFAMGGGVSSRPRTRPRLPCAPSMALRPLSEEARREAPLPELVGEVVFLLIVVPVVLPHVHCGLLPPLGLLDVWPAKFKLEIKE